MITTVEEAVEAIVAAHREAKLAGRAAEFDEADIRAAVMPWPPQTDPLGDHWVLQPGWKAAWYRPRCIRFSYRDDYKVLIVSVDATGYEAAAGVNAIRAKTKQEIAASAAFSGIQRSIAPKTEWTQNPPMSPELIEQAFKNILKR